MKLLQILFSDVDWSVSYNIIVGMICMFFAFELITMAVNRKDRNTKNRRALRRGDLPKI